MKTAVIKVGFSTCKTMMVVTVPTGPFGAHKNMGFDRDKARALIADQLTLFKLLWPDAPLPVGRSV